MSRQVLLRRAERYFVLAMALFIVCGLLFVWGIIMTAVQQYTFGWILYGVGFLGWIGARWADARGDRIRDNLPPVTLYRRDD